MKSSILSLMILLLFVAGIKAQYISGVTYPDSTKTVITDENLDYLKFGKSITAEELSKHLHIMASDEFEGRETGEKGNEMAAEYIAMQFKALDLPAIGDGDTYFQDVYFNRTSWGETGLNVNGNEHKHLWDFMTFATMNEGMPDTDIDEVVFLGYGIDDEKYSDYKGNDLNGKVIMINKGEPFDKDSLSYITGTTEVSDWSRGLRKKLEAAKANGVKLVLVIENDLKEILSKNRRFLVSPSLRLGDGKTTDQSQANHMYISSTIAKEIINSKAKKITKWRKKLKKKGKAKDICLPTDIDLNLKKEVNVIAGYNVMGFIEGTDKKDEIVVVSAHYDHLGKRGEDIYNGADDNGSGTVTVIELADAFAQAKKAGKGPRRSILFLLVTGEEKGLLGSKYYSENPVFPIANTVADVNIDMVGRTDKKYRDNSNYIYVIGSDRISRELHDINERINQDYSQIILDYKYNDEKDRNRYYFRSDHYNFAKKGIPSIFFFSGTHEDYHRTSDTVEKIDFEKMEKLGRHFFNLIWELSNKEDRLIINEEFELE